MRTLLLLCLAISANMSPAAEQFLESIRFDLVIGATPLTCASFLQGDTDGSLRYAPVLVFPADLSEECTVGYRAGRWLITARGSSELPQQSHPWYIQIRGVRVQAEAGRVYLVTREQGVLSVALLESTVTPESEKDSLKAKLARILDEEGAQPGATGNLDSAPMNSTTSTQLGRSSRGA